MTIAINGTDNNPLTSRDIDASPNYFIFVCGRFGFSGNYVTGGDLLDWTTVAGLPIASSICLQVFVDWQALGNGYFPIGNFATALNAWKLKLQAVGTFNTELAAAPYPAGITNDTVFFQATFRKLL